MMGGAGLKKVQLGGGDADVDEAGSLAAQVGTPSLRPSAVVRMPLFRLPALHLPCSSVERIQCERPWTSRAAQRTMCPWGALRWCDVLWTARLVRVASSPPAVDLLGGGSTGGSCVSVLAVVQALRHAALCPLSSTVCSAPPRQTCCGQPNPPGSCSSP